jgi:lipid-binding SYLF domain-containing protein
MGFAIFTIFKAGLLFSARAGTGIVICRLPDGTWSSPSAIGTAGLGVGTQLGAEMTDFLIVLNSRSAVVSQSLQLWMVSHPNHCPRKPLWLADP